MEKELRQRINGIYIQADVDEIDELVEFIATSTDQVAIEKAASRLRTYYGADRTGENMRKYSINCYPYFSVILISVWILLIMTTYFYQFKGLFEVALKLFINY